MKNKNCSFSGEKLQVLFHTSTELFHTVKPKEVLEILAYISLREEYYCKQWFSRKKPEDTRSKQMVYGL